MAGFTLPKDIVERLKPKPDPFDSDVTGIPQGDIDRFMKDEARRDYDRQQATFRQQVDDQILAGGGFSRTDNAPQPGSFDVPSPLSFSFPNRTPLPFRDFAGNEGFTMPVDPGQRDVRFFTQSQVNDQADRIFRREFLNPQAGVIPSIGKEQVLNPAQLADISLRAEGELRTSLAEPDALRDVRGGLSVAGQGLAESASQLTNLNEFVNTNVDAFTGGRFDHKLNLPLPVAETFSPAGLGIAGAGGALASGLRSTGVRGAGLLAGLVEPFAPRGAGLGTRLGTELLAAIGAHIGTDLAEDAPPPVQIGAGLVGGVLGGLSPSIGRKVVAPAVRGAINPSFTPPRPLAGQAAPGLSPTQVDARFPRQGTIGGAADIPPERALTVQQDRSVVPSGPRSSPDVIDPPELGAEILGLRPIDIGLTRPQRIRNAVNSVLNRPINRDAVATPAMAERARVKLRAESIVTSMTERTRVVIQDAFPDMTKNGQIPSLEGIDLELPVAPDIADIAARLPRFEPFLSLEQQAALR